MNKNLKRFFFLPLLLFCINIYASIEIPKGSIHGTVTTSDGKPAEMVTITIEGTNRSTITDHSGKFTFLNIKDGNYVLKVTLLGYENIEQGVTVSNEASTAVNIQLSLSNKQLEEVIVRATGKRPHDLSSDYVARMPLKNIENPQVYSSIGKTILENQLLFSADDAFRNVTGIQKMWGATNRAGDGGAFINLRGFISGNSLRNGLAAPVSTTIDAVNIEKIEVLKGPSATLFGSNITSYGGVINRVTKKPYEVFGGNVSIAGGSYNFYRAQADINAPLTKDKKLLFRLNAAYTSTGNFQKKDAKNQLAAFVPSLSYKPTDKIDINLEYENFYTKAVPEQVFFYLSPLLGVNNMRTLEKAGLDYKNSYNGAGLSTIAKVNNLMGQINYRFNEHFRSSTNINTSSSYSDGYNPYFAVSPLGVFTNNPNDTQLGVVRADQSTRNSGKKYFQIQQNFNADFKIGEMRNRAVAGFDYLRTKDDQMFNFFYPFDWVPFNGGDYGSMNKETVGARYASGTGVGTYASKGVLNTYSGYIADVFTPLTGLNILASVRYENNNFKGGITGTNTTLPYKQAAWSPKFGITYQILQDKLSSFINYQNSFTNRGYFTSDNKGTQTLSTPELANQFEGGFKASIISGKINAVLSYYNIKVRNSLVADVNNPVLDDTGQPIPFQFVNTQAGKLTSKGVELELDAYLVKGFSVIGGVSYNDSKYITAIPDVQGRRPNTASSPWLVNFNASYQFMDGRLKGLGFGMGGNYASNNNIVNTKIDNVESIFTLPEYFVLNANAYYDAKRFRIGIKADNFTNEHYWLGYTTANPQSLINVAGSLTFKF